MLRVHFWNFLHFCEKESYTKVLQRDYVFARVQELRPLEKYLYWKNTKMDTWYTLIYFAVLYSNTSLILVASGYLC